MNTFRLRKDKQKGFTLIELILAIAIAGVLGTGISMTFSQLFNANTFDKNSQTAIMQVQYAVDAISRDVQQIHPAPQSIISGSTLSLSVPVPATGGGVFTTQLNTVTYTLDSNQQLLRNSSTVIATNITYFSVDTSGSVPTVTITAEVGDRSETRIFPIIT